MARQSADAWAEVQISEDFPGFRHQLLGALDLGAVNAGRGLGFVGAAAEIANRAAGVVLRMPVTAATRAPYPEPRGKGNGGGLAGISALAARFGVIFFDHRVCFR